MAQQRNLKQQCPFASQPFSECESHSVTGRNIPVITRKCMGDFSSCAIYLKRRAQFLSEININECRMDYEKILKSKGE